MYRRLTISGLVAFVILAAPASTWAFDPVSAAFKFSIEYLISRYIADTAFDYAEGKPNIKEIAKRLKELEDNAFLWSEMRDEIRRVREGLNDRVTKGELREKLLGLQADLDTIRKRLSDLEEAREENEVRFDDNEHKTTNSKNSGYFLDRGRQFASKKEFYRAIANFALAIRLDEKLIDAYLARGTAFVELKAMEVAIIDYSKAVELDEDQHHRSRAFRGYAYLEINENYKAIVDFNIIINKYKDDETTLRRRGYAYFKLNKWHKASADFQACVKLCPERAVTWYYLALTCSHTHDDEKSIEYYSHAIDIAKDDKLIINCYNGRAVTFYNIKKYINAINDCDVVIRRSGDVTQAWEIRGLSKYRLHERDGGRQDDPMPDLRRAIQLGSENFFVKTIVEKGHL